MISIDFIPRFCKSFFKIAIGLLISILNTYGQSVSKPMFFSITENEGLISNNTYNLIQDSQGFIWIATDKGISRYDGQQIDNFIAEDSRYRNDIIDLVEDHLGRIWFLDYSKQIGFIENGKINTSLQRSWLPTTTDFHFHLAKSETKSFLVAGKGFWELKEDSAIWHNLEIHQVLNAYIDDENLNLVYSDQTVIYHLPSDTFISVVEKHDAEIAASVHSNGTTYNLEQKKISAIGNINQTFESPLKEEQTHSTFGNIQVFKNKIYGVNYNHFFEIIGSEIFWFTFGNQLFLRNAIALPNGSYCVATVNHGLLFWPGEFIHSQQLISCNSATLIDHYSFGEFHFAVTNDDQLLAHHINTNATKTIKFERKTFGSKVRRVQKIGNQSFLLTTSDEIYRFTLDQDLEILSIQKFDYLHKALKDSYLDNQGNLFLATSSSLLKKGGGQKTKLNGKRTYSIHPFESHIYVHQEDNMVRYDIESREIKNYPNYPVKSILRHNPNEILILTPSGFLVLMNEQTKKIKPINGLKNIIQIAKYKEQYIALTANCIYKIKINESAAKVVLNIKQRYSFQRHFKTPLKDLTVDHDQIFLLSSSDLIQFEVATLFPEQTPQADHIKQIESNFSNKWSSSFRLTPDINHLHIRYLNADFTTDSFQYYLNGDLINTHGNQFRHYGIAEGEHVLKVNHIDKYGNRFQLPTLFFSKQVQFTQSSLFRKLIVVLLSLLTALILLIVYRHNSQKQRTRLENSQKESESKLIALKSQMNPHFIHNSLNSILALTIAGDIKSATKYMNVFSDFFREILETTRHNYHAISQEISLLEKYISLESERFDNAFSYEIECLPNKSVVESELIPTGLLQPLVENALWHGLMSDEEKKDKTLRIRFESNKDRVLVQIIDNGKGIDVNKVSPDSLALKNIEERVQLINNLGELHLTFDVSPIQNQHQQSGTICNLNITHND